MTRAVRYVSAAPGDGYGDAGVGMMRALRHRGIAVEWTMVDWTRGGVVPRLPDDALLAEHGLGDVLTGGLEHDTVVLHVPPPAFARFLPECKGRRVVGLTTWETDQLPVGWREQLDDVDVVIVPSQFNRDVFAGAGLRPPVRVVPHLAHVPSDVAPLTIDVLRDRFVFYAMGPWSTRKAMAETVRAHLDAFAGNDDVALVVKTTPVDLQAIARLRADRSSSTGAGDGTTWWSLAELLRDRPRPPAVHLIAEPQPRAAVDALHARGDCFVSLTRSEGFGLNILDAAVAGNPVVVTGWGGHLDFLGPDHPLLVDYTLAPIDDDPVDLWTTATRGRWARADHDDAVDKLRWVAAHPTDAREDAATRAARVRATHSLEAIGGRLVTALD